MTRAAVTLGFALLAATACAEGVVTVEDVWAWPTSQGPTAAYLSIHNGTDAPDRLTGARSPCCATIEIHRTTIDGDRMSMAPADDGIVVEAGASVALKPGGHHLMLFEPREPLRDGMRFPITLVFESRGEIEIEAVVRR